jgi:hypothetical protein
VAARAAAERRQLTVMFSDLVGSTALSARLDPEDLREVIGAYHSAVAEIVAGLGGFVSRFMGDGVLIYFGYPQAHEDAAERAVRAALGAIDAVRRLNVKSVKLRTRVGIATGLVVVGDLIGAGSAQEQSVVGETPNLAARRAERQPEERSDAPRWQARYKPLQTKHKNLPIRHFLGFCGATLFPLTHKILIKGLGNLARHRRARPSQKPHVLCV